MPDEVSAIDCTSALRQLWDYLDSELNDTRMGEVRHHLETCEHCFQNADFSRRFLDALIGARERQVLPAVVRSQVMAALAQAGLPAS